MNTLTANELKTKGSSVVESSLKDDDEVVISVRGENRYVVMELDKCAKLREYELIIALQEAKAHIALSVSQNCSKWKTMSFYEKLNIISS